MTKVKKIVFMTGTRADYGKIKPLMMRVENSNNFECYLFVTGMHTIAEFGDTQDEIIKDGYKNIHIYMNQIVEEPMDLVLANTINGFSRYVRNILPDMIIVHGDRVEALAAAITGALNNILVAHIEGGEVSGTIDESLRHSISKLAHIHFVSNEKAKHRLIQLGEDKKTIFVIGAPDIDTLFQKSSLSFDEVKLRYEILFEHYSILMFHPVTTEEDLIEHQAYEIVDAILASGDNCIVINPNNDLGYKKILAAYGKLNNNSRIRRFPSIRFEFFVELLKRADYLIGNSSAGIHEAPSVGIPSINIGNRQYGRYKYSSIINCPAEKREILNAIIKVKSMLPVPRSTFFGDGNSAYRFMEIIKSSEIWEVSKQKIFIDI